MASNEVKDSNSSSQALRTPRPFSGTQLRPSYSETELGTPSGEVVFNYRRQDHGREEDQVYLPPGRKSPRMSLSEENPEGPRKTPGSGRMGMLEEMLASVGNLRGELERQMTTLTKSNRETTRSMDVPGLTGTAPGIGGGESPVRQRVVGHVGWGNSSHTEGIRRGFQIIIVMSRFQRLWEPG